MLGKDLSPYEKEELTRAFNSVGPFAEKTVRFALEHTLKLHGRGLHISVYSHYLKQFPPRRFQGEPGVTNVPPLLTSSYNTSV